MRQLFCEGGPSSHFDNRTFNTSMEGVPVLIVCNPMLGQKVSDPLNEDFYIFDAYAVDTPYGTWYDIEGGGLCPDCFNEESFRVATAEDRRYFLRRGDIAGDETDATEDRLEGLRNHLSRVSPDCRERVLTEYNYLLSAKGQGF